MRRKSSLALVLVFGCALGGCPKSHETGGSAKDAGRDAGQDAAPAADGGSSGTLTWQETCGAPVCREPAVDDPNVVNCKPQSAGASCSTRDDQCDLVNACGTTLVCTDVDPTHGGMCPISRAKYKRDINYLTKAERERVYQDLLAIPLASYEYKTDPQGNPQLGFILEDVEPSPATRGDHVNLYGYLTMAVNAVQLQAKEIQALKQELEVLRARSDAQSSSCEP